MDEDISIHAGVKREFGLLDYVLFSILFVISTFIGVYHAYKDRKISNVRHFHLGNRQMHPIPVSLSLAATFLSAITLIGIPAEIYKFGTMYAWLICGTLIATAGAAHVFLPVFYSLNTTSCLAYLQMRFGTVVRVIISIMFILQTLIYMGFILYVPSLSFQAVTGLSLWGTMIGVSAVCTLYTMLGGIKTVLWTDSLQLIIMFAGLLTLVITGLNRTGGLTKAWETASTHGRIELANFSPDPRTRHSVWSVSIGGGLFWSYLYGVNQAQVQRQCSLPTLTKAQTALWLNFPALVVINALACLLGVVMFAFYSKCDPVKVGLVDKPDQLVPLMVLDVLGSYEGLPGIFMASVFSGSLSSMSSGLNAMSAVVTEDYLKHFCCKSLSGRKELFISKLMVLMFGFANFAVAVIISQANSVVALQLSYSLYAILSGPVFGCFIAGMIFPWTNKTGALIGLITSLGMVSWLVLGAQINRPSGIKPLPVRTDGCRWINSINHSQLVYNTSLDLSFNSHTLPNNTTIVSIGTVEEEPRVYDFYRMSYMWYASFGMIINIIVSLFISFVTGPLNPKKVNSKLMSPLFYKMFPFLPESIRRYLYLGVDYSNTLSDDKIDEEISLNVSCDNQK
ncbi:sodium-coupled monocarboxylate transporter 1-like [Ruditapes philippinarum]|uniref:sodium-coupled monocarboxylate transporter 1-like n=1 Tax=Ruditapes philippinarum TaxID=129788 RepID=UPI00295BCE29|nr:sodium-coupled monocarboxylate transporter 1-like [Ruditapes philippinarum]